MPIYCWYCEHCDLLDETWEPRAEPRAPRCAECGRALERDYRVERSGRGYNPANWPKRSMAAGVRAAEVPMKERWCRQHGHDVTFDQRGNVYFPSPSAQKKYLKAHGMIDYDSYG